MPYVTSIERLAMRKGIRKGIESVLRLRFGEEGLKLMPEICEVHEEEQLEAIATPSKRSPAPPKCASCGRRQLRKCVRKK